jgi:Mn-dependent DtxR family transcriptional regulator
MIHDLESVLKFPQKDPHGKPIPGYSHARLLGTVERDSEGRSGEGLLDIYSREGKGESS